MPSPRPPRQSSQESRDKRSEHSSKHKTKFTDNYEHSRSRYTSDDDYKGRKEDKKTQQYEDFEETKSDDDTESKKDQRYEESENSKIDRYKGSKKQNKREHSEESKTDKYKEYKKARRYEDSDDVKTDKYKESKKRRQYEDLEETESRYSSRPRRESYESHTKSSRQELVNSDGRDNKKQSRQSKFDSSKEVMGSDKDTERDEHSDSDHDGSSTPDPTPHEYRRYWGRRNSDVHRRSRQSIDKSDSSSRFKHDDRYWSKYPANDDEHSVGPRYYEKASKRGRQSNSRYKENLNRKRGGESDEEKSRSRNAQDDDRRRSGGNKRWLGEPNPSLTSTSNELAEDRSIPKENPPAAPPRQKKNLDMLTTKTGGAYIPPARLRMMQAQITDKSSAAYQRLSWEALKKSIHGHINKVNVGNIGVIVRELLKENIVRGRGLLCRSIIQAQAASPTFTHVYAALVSVINSKFPNIGELLLRRLIIQFKRGFKRNDKSICISAASFVAHLVNQSVVHEILALEILTLLVENPTDDSVEVSIAFLKECGMKLMEVSNKGVHAIFEMLRNILHEGHLDIRVQYMIEVMFQVRKDNFRDHQAVQEDLDLVGEEDQFTHLLTLEDVKDGEDILNVFKLDPEYEESEAKYKALKKEILDEDSSGSGGDSGSGEESEEESENEDETKESLIIDNTETNLIALRRTIYLTIHSSLDFEECAHKLMRMELKPGQEIELCHMFLDCCAEQRTYEKFYGLLAQRFCQINKIFIPPFQQIFNNTYNTIHRLDTNKLRNVAKFFAHLLFTDAISWEVLSLIHLNEEETTSSSRIFIKILFQELSEYMGLTKLNERVKDSTLQEAFEGLFPRDNPKNTRFAINFFTSIGLGGLTDELREHLKSQPRVSVLPKPAETVQVSSDSSSSDSTSSSSSSDSSSDSSSSSSSSESEDSDDRSKSKKGSRKAEREKRRRKKKGGSKAMQKKKSIGKSPPKHKKKKSKR